MGGFGSGRWGGRPTVEGVLALDVANLLRTGRIRPECWIKGTIIWTYTASGERASSIGYTADLGSEHGHLRLYWATAAGTDEERSYEQRVELTTTPQPFGGRRWWLVCPHKGRLVTKLYLPAGARTFASREAYRLAYTCQRETPQDRALRRAHKLRRRLGDYGAVGDEIEKPKGMHWATFEKKLDEIGDAEDQATAHLWLFISKLDRPK